MERKMKNSQITWIGDIPISWSVKKVKDGFTQKKSKAFQEEPVVLSLARSGVKVRDMSTNEGQFAASYFEYNPVSIDDLLINPMDLISGDNCSISEVEGVISPAYVNLRYKQGFNPRYYHYYFKMQYWLMAFFAHGKGVSYDNRWTLNNDSLMNFPILVPDSETQKKIANYLDEKISILDDLSDDIQSEIEKMDDYKKAVIFESVTKGLKSNIEMKDSGIPWIGLIPQTWSVKKIKHHLRRNEPRNPGDKQVLSVYREYGVIPKDSRDDNHNVTSEDTSKYKYIRPGNLVINKMKAWQGSMGVSEYEGIVSPAYFVFEFIDDQIESKYLHHLLRICYRDEFRRISGGIREGQWDLPADGFLNEFIPVPPKKEQLEIVNHISDKLAQIDALIEKKKEQLTILDQYKKSLVFEVVTGKKEAI